MDKRLAALVALPHVAWLAVLFVLPLGFMAAISLLLPEGLSGYKEGLSLANYARMLEDPYPRIFLRSFGVAAAATGLCLALALPMALAIAKAPRHWRNSLLVMVCLPFWVSVMVRMLALTTILGRHGIVNDFIVFCWEIAARIAPFIPPAQPLDILYSRFAVVIGLAYVFIPFALLPIYSVLARIDPHLNDASYDLGAGYWTTVRRIVIPLAWPGIAAAAILVFVPSLGAFYVTDMLGGQNDILLGNLIEIQYKQASNWPFGAALSLALVALTAAGLALLGRRLREPGSQTS